MEDRLQKFAQLVDAGGYTKAAAELHISQPALSTAIAKLERELKALLLVRGVRPLALTPAGHIAYQAAKDLAVRTDNLRLTLAELANQPISLTFGMIDSVADALFAQSSALSVLDGAKVSIVVNNSRYLAEAVERSDLDIAFVVAQHRRQHPLVEAKTVGTEPLVVVASTRHAVPSSGTDLPDFISYDQASTTASLILAGLKEYGVTPTPSFYSTSPEVILRLALLGKGVAALPYLMVQPHLQNDTLQRLGAPEPWLIPRQIISLKRRDKDMPLPLRQLTHQITKSLDDLMTAARTA